MPRKRYREWTLDQPYLLPPSLKDWLPDDHRVYRVLEVVEALDIQQIKAEVESKDSRGTRPYNPRMMLALLIFGYSEGVYSSRKIARAAQERIPFRVLTANSCPHFTVVNRFRDRHRDALPGLFAQVVMLCREMGLVDLKHVAVDGTKLQANASKHKAMSYGCMQKELRGLEEEIRKILDRAEAEDAEEDELYGAGRDRDELPEELKRREDRIARIREAMEKLKAQAQKARAQELSERARALREKAESEEDPTERKRKLTRAERNQHEAERLAEDMAELEEASPTALPANRIETTKDGSPAERAQRNFTDPESRIMCRNKEFLQGYNAQAAVDSRYQVIVGVGLSNQAPDQEYLLPMLERVRAIWRRLPEKVTADSGYMSASNASWCEHNGIDAYIATSRKTHRAAGTMANVPESWEAMAEKLRTDQGRAVYSQRKAIVEPVFGQIREARGFTRFSMRGRAKAEAEWTLIAMVHNILKLIGAGASRHCHALVPA